MRGRKWRAGEERDSEQKKGEREGGEEVKEEEEEGEKRGGRSDRSEPGKGRDGCGKQFLYLSINTKVDQMVG